MVDLTVDDLVLACRVCGVLFVGRAGWQPICLHCWRRIRDELLERVELDAERQLSAEPR